MSKENIIANILSAAEAESAKVLSLAKERVTATEKVDEEYREELKRQADKHGAESEKTAVSRAVSLAKMDANKVVLNAKQQKISEAFAQAEEEILRLPAQTYRAFLRKLLDEYAAEGDTAVFSASDKNKLTEQEVADYAKKRGIRLSYRADGAFSGGVILEGKNCDKNATLSILLKEYRETHAGEIATVLIGE